MFVIRFNWQCYLLFSFFQVNNGVEFHIELCHYRTLCSSVQS